MGRGVRFVALGAGVAALLWVFGAGFFAGAILNHPGQDRYQPYRYAADKPLEIDPAATSRPSAYAFQYRSPCENPKGHDESDLCAQWKAANAAQDSALWTKWGFWIGVIGSALLLWQIILTRKAVEDTTKATHAMERQNELTQIAQRPWIKLVASVSKIEVDIDEIILCVAVEAINIGKSVALDVGLHVNVVRDHTISDRILEMTRKQAAERDGQGIPIVPGDKQTQWAEVHTTIDEMKLIGPDGDRRVPFKAFAAVVYNVPGDPEIKVSEKAFVITEEESLDRFKFMGIKYPVRNDLKVDDLKITSSGLVRVT
jgi:hypothetical protein